jgi:hypothetical protein
MWRRLKGKWEVEGIWCEDNDNANDDESKVPNGKAKGKGKEKAKAPKGKKGDKADKKFADSDAEDGFEAEGSGMNRDLEEDSDAGIKVADKHKTLCAGKHQIDEEEGDGDEV